MRQRKYHEFRKIIILGNKRPFGYFRKICGSIRENFGVFVYGGVVRIPAFIVVERWTSETARALQSLLDVQTLHLSLELHYFARPATARRRSRCA